MKAFFLALLLTAPASIAFAQQPAPSAATKPDPAFEAAKRAFEALPEADRRSVQEALVWTGDLNGTSSGAFGRLTYNAILAYQRRAKAQATGILDDASRAALLLASRKVQDAAGFKAVTDAATGISIGIPERILPKREVDSRGGTRWQSVDGRITVASRAVSPAEGDLAALFERTVGLQTPGRQVTYKLLRPDFFVVAGETPTGRFYIRYASGPSGIRGFTIGYDKARAAEFERTVIAISNSFVPFPDARQAAAQMATTIAPPRPLTPPTPPPAPPKPVLIATALAVAPGRAVTASVVDSCPELRIGGRAARIAGKDGDVRLVTFEGGPRSAPLAGTGAPPASGAPVLAIAMSTSFGAAAPVAAPGTIGADGTILAPLQVGAAGAPVFDAGGALVGLVAASPLANRQVAGLVPPIAYPLAGSESLGRLVGRDLLAGAGEARPAGATLAAVAPALLAVECLRP